MGYQYHSSYWETIESTKPSEQSLGSSVTIRTMAIADAGIGLRTVTHWIGGRPAESTYGRSGVVWNPATGQAQAKVDFASIEDVDRAVAAAKGAFEEWRATPLSRRSEVMFKLRELVDGNRRGIAGLITSEHGKTLPDAMGEVARGLENIEFACGIPSLLKGGFSEQASRGIDVYQIRQPLGVVAGITPFNFPAMVPMWMFPGAIACGNTFILKPSEKDPSVSLFLAELLKQAGVPDGVFNVVQGDKVAVDRLLEHADVKAVSFVGSTPVARFIYETATRNGKRVQALGGAKNHMLVLPDADVPMAADAAISAAYGSAGERCMAIAVVVAVGNVADPLVDAIRERMANIKVGPGLDEAGNDAGNEMGPLITREHRDRVASYVANAASEGAAVAMDGRQHDTASDRAGFFLGPSLLDQVQPGMRCYRDEIFGPVLGVVRVDTYDEALRIINENPYGNGVAIFTRDGGAARQFQFDVEAGMVGINVPIPVPVAYYSFGGWKASLFGDLHIYGPEGVQFYTRTKVVTSRWPDPGSSQVDLGFPQVR
jgi:malonate-semialdehyde dehydrogenase (acetylating)/methylmalonate-semialdehyde dehydrogenase